MSRPGQFGPTRRLPLLVQIVAHLHHVLHRDALGDADDQRHAGVGRLEHRVGGRLAPGTNITEQLAPVASTAILAVSKTGTLPSSTHSPPLPGRHAGDDLRAVLQHLLGVEHPFAAR